MKRQNAAYWFLSVTAAIMFAMCMYIDRPARAEVVTKDDRGDYFIVTNAGQGGSDVLYIADGRRGMMAVFVWDNASRSLQARGLTPLTAAWGR